MTEFNPFSEENTEIDATNVTEESVNDASGGVSQTGKYHFSCQEVKFDNLAPDPNTGVIRVPQCKLVMKVLDGEHASEKDKLLTISVRLMNPEDWADFRRGEDGSEAKGGPLKPLNERDKKGILSLYYAFGVVDNEVFGKKTRMSKELFEAMYQQQAICEVTEYVSKGNNKVYREIKPHNCWRVGDPRVADVPKDIQLARMAGIELAAPVEDAPDLDI